MALIFSSGFELNSATNLMEWGTSGSPTIDNATFRTGAYAGAIASLTSGVNKNFQYQWAAADTVSDYRLVFYFRVATNPNVTTTIASIATNAGAGDLSIKLTTGGALQLFRADGVTQVGSDSTALSANTWYKIGLRHFNQAAGIGIADCQINNVTFASASNLTLAGVNNINLGGNIKGESCTTLSIFFDDVTFCDQTGSFLNNGWIRDYSHYTLRPNAVGDNSGGTPTGGANWTNVEEIPPDDITTIVTFTSGGAATDDYGIDDTPAGILATSDILAATVNVRGSSNDATASIKARIKASAGGVVELSGNIAFGATGTYFTNSTNALIGPKLILYNKPGADNGPWRKADLDVAQIGVADTGVTGATTVSAVWLNLIVAEPSSKITPTNKLRPAIFTGGIAR